jgi:hypothetical protein
MADSLASKAGRTRPPIVGRWPGPVLSSFVTANLESETNFLRPDIRVGRVVASVGDPPLEMPLPFGRRDLQLVRSGSAAVLRVDAVRGSPDERLSGGCPAVPIPADPVGWREAQSAVVAAGDDHIADTGLVSIR